MLPALIIAAALSQTQPGATDLAPAFGNTLRMTYPDGRAARTWLSEDGTYRGQGRRGRITHGVWRVRDGEVCFSQRRPLPLPGSFCTPIVRGGVGTTWTARAVTGEMIRIELVAGR